jgi:hypothetical protein
LIERNIEGGRGCAQESSGTGGTFIVHAKIHYFAGSANANRFGVLTTHVYDRPGAGEHANCASRVATDFSNLRVTEGDAIAAVTRSDDVFDFLFLDICRLQGLREGLFGSKAHVGAGVDQSAAGNVFCFVDDHGFCLRGADVDPSRVSRPSLLLAEYFRP